MKYRNLLHLMEKKKIKEENYYFTRPLENKFSDEELYEMNIREIIIAIHPTIYKKNKKIEKSFHPFFYLKLQGNNISDFGVIVQYIKIPPNVEENQKHVYEEDGVEFIEKNEEDFENEFRNILYYGGIKTSSIINYIITYNSSEFEPMNLGDFFIRAIPHKGKWLQENLNPKNQENS